MSLRSLGILQWVGLLAGALTWAAEHVVGYGVTLAECNAAGGGPDFGIANDTWQVTLTATSVAVVLAAEGCAAVVFARTRGAEFGDGPPREEEGPGAARRSRLHFFSAAALAANAIFLAIVLLDGFASIFDIACRQA